MVKRTPKYIADLQTLLPPTITRATDGELHTRITIMVRVLVVDCPRTSHTCNGKVYTKAKKRSADVTATDNYPNNYPASDGERYTRVTIMSRVIVGVKEY